MNDLRGSCEYVCGLLRDGTREDLIRWLQWNDPNGIYSDRDAQAEGMDVLTYAQARGLVEEAMREMQAGDPASLTEPQAVVLDALYEQHDRPYRNVFGFGGGYSIGIKRIAFEKRVEDLGFTKKHLEEWRILRRV